MLDYSFWSAYQCAVLGDTAYRCTRCGQGPVSTSDGLLMTYCPNCDASYSSVTPIDLGLGRLKDFVLRWFRRFKQMICKRASDLKTIPQITSNADGEAA